MIKTPLWGSFELISTVVCVLVVEQIFVCLLEDSLMQCYNKIGINITIDQCSALTMLKLVLFSNTSPLKHPPFKIVSVPTPVEMGSSDQ